ncbi:MAG: FMN phosphatase YigB (HAD superfamily) [Acidimicrobiales bacterium]
MPDAFDAQVLGFEHGFEKQDPRAFTRLANQLAIDERHLLDVGDGQDEAEGANGGGATWVFINRVGASVNPAWVSAPDCHLSNLEQIETLLRRQSSWHLLW